ncbi:MAG: tetratricopeptide repeat protein [Candidatus Omnitrophota bacterium]
MNIPRLKIPALSGLRLLAGPVFFILLIVSFFIIYNSFLVDRSIESLKFSLYDVNSAEAANSAYHVAPLVEVQFVGELSSSAPSSEELINLGYTSGVLEGSSPERKVKDAGAVMEEVIRSRESKRNSILRFFDKINNSINKFLRKMPFLKRTKVSAGPGIDQAILKKINEHENKGDFNEAIKLYRDTIKRFLNYAQTPSLILRLGYLLHRIGRFKEAEELYTEIATRFPNTPEARVTGELMDILKKRSLIDKESDEIISMIAAAENEAIKQQLYYKKGLAELSVLNLEDSKKSFNKAISILPEGDIADKARFRMGVCERLLGQLDSSLESFKNLADIATNPELKMQSLHQLAQVYQQKGDYDKSTSSLENMLKGYNDKAIVPLLLFQLGSTYLYDAKDPAKAKKIFEELRIQFPGRLLVFPGTSFVSDELDLDVLPEMPEEIEMLMSKSWLEKVLPEETLRRIEARALGVSSYVIQTAKNTISEQEEDDDENQEDGKKDKEDKLFTVEVTQNMANKYVQEDGSGAEDNLSIEYSGAQQMKVYSNITLPGGKIVRGYLSGAFKMVSMVKEPYWVEGEKRQNYIIFTVDECRVGNIMVPPDIMNAVLRSSIENFNADFPLDIQEFNLTKDTIMLAGPVKGEAASARISSAEYQQGIKEAIFKELEKSGIGRGAGGKITDPMSKSIKYNREKKGLDH